MGPPGSPWPGRAGLAEGPGVVRLAAWAKSWAEQEALPPPPPSSPSSFLPLSRHLGTQTPLFIYLVKSRLFPNLKVNQTSRLLRPTFRLLTISLKVLALCRLRPLGPCLSLDQQSQLHSHTNHVPGRLADQSRLDRMRDAGEGAGRVGAATGLHQRLQQRQEL